MKIVYKILLVVIVLQKVFVASILVELPNKQQQCFKSLQDYIDFRDNWKGSAKLPDPGDVFINNYQTQRETPEQVAEFNRDQSAWNAYLKNSDNK